MNLQVRRDCEPPAHPRADNRDTLPGNPLRVDPGVARWGPDDRDDDAGDRFAPPPATIPCPSRSVIGARTA